LARILGEVMNTYAIAFPDNDGLKLFECIVARNTDFGIKVIELETTCFVKCSEEVYKKLQEISVDEEMGFPAMFLGMLPIERKDDDSVTST
jgi:hypothetical protein